MTANNFKDLTGNVYNRLTVLYRDISQGKRTMWMCRCVCGNIKSVRSDHLRTGSTTSCGCYSKESHTAHDMSRTSEYHIWTGIKQRTTNPKNKYFPYYGGRGIDMCKEWINSFESFIADMGRKPSPELTIDRIDNNKGYSPENCRWATRKEQVCNRRSSIFFTFNGATMCLKDWCRFTGVKYTTAIGRIKSGKSIKESLKL